jgi:SAM-dependent methyltransferase
MFIEGVALTQAVKMSYMGPTSTRRSVFDAAAAEYDAARPSYPAGLFDEMETRTGSLAGKLVLDWGAGTGISSRQLAERGAAVASFDIGEEMLRRALARSPQSACILADGNRMPIAAGTVDLTTFAQSWHWFDPHLATAEVARVLKPGGYWAAWWNRAKADGEAWFDAYQDVLASSCPGYNWQHLRDEQMAPDWSNPVAAAAGQVEPAGIVVVRWTRQVRLSDWLTDERSKSYVIELEPALRQSVLDQVAAIFGEQFPDGQLVVPYITTLVLARKAG